MMDEREFDREMDAAVIPFPRGAFEKRHNELQAAMDDECPVRLDDRIGGCFHRQHGASISPNDRRVRCRGCKTELDPIDVLTWLAGNRERLVRRGFSLRREVEWLEDRVAELKRDERNTKNRLDRARARLTQIVVELSARTGLGHDEIEKTIDAA